MVYSIVTIVFSNWTAKWLCRPFDILQKMVDSFMRAEVLTAEEFASHKIEIVEFQKLKAFLWQAFELLQQKHAVEQKLTQTAEQTAKFMKLLSGTMSHELCTPLRVIDTEANVIRRSLPMLVAGYEAAANASLPIPSLPSMIEIEDLKKTLDIINNEVSSIFATVGILLNKENLPKFDEKTFQQLSISDCIGLALMRYPFESGEKELVVWPAAESTLETFEFCGNNLLMLHVLFNLLKNSFGAIKEAGKGKIYLWLTADDKFNYLHFKDTAKGMSAETAAHVFDYLFTQSKHGTGIGLTFVKTVMENFNGDISCKAAENEFSEFILKFPRLG